jgi:hypothetical protein
MIFNQFLEMIFTLNSTAFASFIQKLQNKECAHHLIKSGGEDGLE